MTTDIVRLLLSRPPDDLSLLNVPCSCECGTTALGKATLFGNVPVIKLLVGAGVSPSARAPPARAAAL